MWVSVGELNAARPLIEALLAKDYPLIVSTTTLTGYNLAHKNHPGLPVLYFPFDLPWIIQKALRQLQPALIVILETEIWPNLLFYASRQEIPVMMVNGRLSQRSFEGYRRFKWFFQRTLSQYHALLMQSSVDANRMTSLGVQPTQVSTVGNLKFDLPPATQTALQKELSQCFQFPPGVPVLVFASTHAKEEELFLEVFRSLQHDFPDLKAVFAPRHPERIKQVVMLLTNHNVNFALRSHLGEAHQAEPLPAIILLDTIGELASVFSLGTVACMGGSFIQWGGHNPLEAINAEIPVIFGPFMYNFKQVVERILEAHAGFKVDSPQEAEH